MLPGLVCCRIFFTATSSQQVVTAAMLTRYGVWFFRWVWEQSTNYDRRISVETVTIRLDDRKIR